MISARVSRTMAIEAMLPGVQVDDDRVCWFRPFGSVQRRDDGVREVYVGGVLIGTFSEPGERNVILVQLAEEPRVATAKDDVLGLERSDERCDRRVHSLAPLLLAEPLEPA